MKKDMSEGCFASEVLGVTGPVLVNFWAPWCGLCRLIDPLLDQFQRDWQHQVKVVNINADRNLKLANTYRITTLPTLILFENGQPSDRLDSFKGKAELRLTLEGMMASRVPSRIS
jgi:thioredoxin 1